MVWGGKAEAGLGGKGKRVTGEEKRATHTPARKRAGEWAESESLSTWPFFVPDLRMMGEPPLSQEGWSIGGIATGVHRH